MPDILAIFHGRTNGGAGRIKILCRRIILSKVLCDDVGVRRLCQQQTDGQKTLLD